MKTIHITIIIPASVPDWTKTALCGIEKPGIFGLACFDQPEEMLLNSTESFCQDCLAKLTPLQHLNLVEL